MSNDNQPQALTATGEPVHGLTATQRVEKERAEAWGYYTNGGGGVVAYFDGYKWYEWACRHIAEDEERARERSR